MAAPWGAIGPGVVIAASVVLAGWVPGAADALAARRRLPLGGTWPWVSRTGRHRWWWVAAPAVAGVTWWRFAAVPAEAVVVLAVGAVAWLDAAVDVRCHRLPDAVAAPLWAVTWAVVAAVSLAGGQPWRLHPVVAASAAAGVVLAVVWLVGMGFGDVKFGAIVAGVVGWQAPTVADAVHRALAMVLVAALASVVWVGLTRLGRARRCGGRLAGGPAAGWFAFGPFLAVGAAVMVLAAGPLAAAGPPG